MYYAKNIDRNVFIRLLIVVLATFLPGCSQESLAQNDDQDNTNAIDGAAYYVSTNGSDSNNGLSSNNPFKTLAKAANMISGPGSCILLKRGDVWSGERISSADKQGTSTNPITISAYGTGANPIIKNNQNPSQSSYAIQINDAGGYCIENIDFTENDIAVDLLFPHRNGRESIRVSNCTFKDNRNNCINISADYEKDIKTGYDYNVRDILIENCNSTNDRKLIGCTITNIEQIDFVTYAIWDLKIRNCNVTSSTGYSAQLRWVRGGYIDGCHFLDCFTGPAQHGSCGILLRRVKSFDIKNTEVGYVNRSLKGSPDGEAIDFEGHVWDCEITNCYLHNCDGPGMMVFYTKSPQGKPIKYNKQNHIRNNIFHHNNQSALHPEDCEIFISDPMVDPEGKSEITGNRYTRVPGVDFILVRPNCSTENILISNNTALEDGALYEWNFDGSTSGIPPVDEEVHTDIKSITRMDNAVKLDIDARMDPGAPAFALDAKNWLGLDMGLNIDAGAYKKVTVNLRNNTTARQLSLFWANTLDEPYSDAKSKTIIITQNTGDFSEYTINLTGSGAWEGNVDKIKLVWPDMTSGTGQIYIDHLKVTQ